MNEEIIAKIKQLREAKGFTHNEMASKLHITRSAYQRLESGETYSWAKYLDELMQTFEITPQEFFKDVGKKVINQQNYDGSVGYAEVLHQENREVYERLIASKDEQIALLKDLLNK